MSEVGLKLKKLGELVEIHNNKRIPLSSKERANLSKIYPYYGAQGIVDYVDNYIFDGKNILIAEDGENLKSNNKSICTLATGKYWVNNHAHIVRANNENDTDYLFYKLNSISFLPYITGSAQPKLNKENLLNIPVYVHDKAEQKNISKLLSKIDQKIALNNQINEELEAMAKTLYDYWFVQFDFPDENGKPYKSSGGKMVYNDQLKREIPEGWGVETLSGLGTIVGGSTPSKSNLDNFVESGQGISWITPNDLSKNKGNKFISKGEIDISEVGRLSANLKVFPKGTVLLSSRAPIGYLAIASNELTTNQGFKSFIPNKEYDENYIYYVIKQSMKVIEQNASGSTFKEISSTVLGEILVVKPKINLIKKFQEKVVSINNQIYVNEVQNQELTQLRDWLLPMLMNGQVKVEEW
ncbi:restriction endonuclease [Streptococcus suis]|nr:restriction endonuclease [Streptococcus suis]KPA64051.1 restriction endonuclease [Streptococcus suis]